MRFHPYASEDFYFYSSVLDEKLSMLENLFATLPDKGNSFLYHVLMLFRQISTEPTAISRLAYLLARHVPSKVNGASDEQIQTYKEFEKNIYNWAIWTSGKQNADEAKERESAAFQTACLIFVYLHRARDEK